MAISKEKKKMKSLLNTHVTKVTLVQWRFKLLSLLGKSTTLTNTLNNTKRPRYLPWFDEKIGHRRNLLAYLHAQTLTVTVS